MKSSLRFGALVSVLSSAHSDQIRVSQRGQVGKAIEAPPKACELTLVPHPV